MNKYIYYMELKSCNLQKKLSRFATLSPHKLIIWGTCDQKNGKEWKKKKFSLYKNLQKSVNLILILFFSDEHFTCFQTQFNNTLFWTQSQNHTHIRNWKLTPIANYNKFWMHWFWIWARMISTVLIIFVSEWPYWIRNAIFWIQNPSKIINFYMLTL